MKKRTISGGMAIVVFLLTATFASAQNYNNDFINSCDFDDRIVIVNDYNDYNGNRNNRRRGNRQIAQERQWKANILQRAYAIAEADGRVTRRELREINRLERDLGISRRNGRGHQGHGHRR